MTFDKKKTNYFLVLPLVKETVKCQTRLPDGQASNVKCSKGFSLIEVILSVALFALLVVAFAGAVVYAEGGAQVAGKRGRAVFVADEGLQAVRSLRDADFANLVDGTHGLSLSGGAWTLSGSSDITDVFTRDITITTIDEDTKNIISRVVWEQDARRQGTIALQAYLTNWLVGSDDWVAPSQEDSFNIDGTQDGVKVQVQGNYAYMVRNGGNPDFIIIDISNPTSPVLAGSLNLSATQIDIVVDGSYAYVASRAENAELQIINIANPLAPAVVATFDAHGDANAHGIYKRDATIYMVRSSSSDDELVIVNVANPQAPTLWGSTGLSGESNDIVAIGNYAYVASGDNGKEVQIVDIAALTSPQVVATYNMSGSDDALSLLAFGATLIVGRGDSGGVSVLSIANPVGPYALGSYATGGSVNDMAINTTATRVWLATSSASAEFQLIDISNPTAIQLIGSLDLTAPLNGISYNETVNYAFAVGDADAEEFIIIAP